MTFTIYCSMLDYPTYQDAWKDHNSIYACNRTVKAGTAYTDVQRHAVEVGYGAIEQASVDYYLGKLYQMCAASPSPAVQFNYYYITAAEAKAAAGELVLCPDHPDAAFIQSAIDHYNGMQVTMSSNLAAATVRSQAVADGTYVEAGHHLVGTEIKPGTWQTVKEKVEDCYWELSDSSGNIIDNNFISVAPQFTINIPASAAGFTNTGCAFQRIGD